MSSDTLFYILPSTGVLIPLHPHESVAYAAVHLADVLAGDAH